MFYYQRENFSNSYDLRCRKHDGYVVPAHLHEYSEFLYVEQGCAEVLVNGRVYNVYSGQLIFIPPNKIHEYRCDKTKVVCGVFSNDFIPLFFKEIGKNKIGATIVDFKAKDFIIEEIYNYRNKSKTQISGYLNLLVSEVLKNPVYEPLESEDNVLYQKVISYLSENFSKDVTLKGIAKHFGYNEKYLSGVLHELTGVNFRKLLGLYRIQKAKELLLNDKTLDIYSVAIDCGYSALNTFNRNFKQFTGVTPTEFKNGSR